MGMPLITSSRRSGPARGSYQLRRRQRTTEEGREGRERGGNGGNGIKGQAASGPGNLNTGKVRVSGGLPGGSERIVGGSRVVQDPRTASPGPLSASERNFPTQAPSPSVPERLCSRCGCRSGA